MLNRNSSRARRRSRSLSILRYIAVTAPPIKMTTASWSDPLAASIHRSGAREGMITAPTTTTNTKSTPTVPVIQTPGRCTDAHTDRKLSEFSQLIPANVIPTRETTDRPYDSARYS